MEATAAGRRLPALIACVVLVLGGCATTGERVESDPIEPFNRGVYRFNDALDRSLLRPTAKAYEKVTPDWFRTGVGNFFTNLSGPRTIINQVLQGKVGKAGQDLGRLLLNLSFGLGGVIDVATMNGMPLHEEDLGQTLGWWGVPPGPFLMLPFFGPSTVRDAPSKIVDTFVEPLYWWNPGGDARYFSFALNFVDSRARLLPFDDIIRQAYDPYAFIRDAYLQRRQYLVFDGNPPEQPLEEFDDPDAVDEGAEGAAAPEDVAPPTGGEPPVETGAPAATEPPAETAPVDAPAGQSQDEPGAGEAPG